MSNIQLINAAFQDAMPTIPTESVDIVITSPPYFVGKEYEKKVTLEDYTQMMCNFYAEATRVLKPAGYIVINFGEIHNSKGRMYKAECPSTYPAACFHFPMGRENGLDLQTMRIWRKHFSKCNRGFSVNIRPMTVYEYEHLWTWRKPGKDGKEFVNNSKLSQRAVLGETWTTPTGRDKHCAAFPIELPQWAMDVYVETGNDNATVLDPFMGSGTTILAAKEKGFNAIGIERDEVYFNYAKERIG